MLVTEYSVCKQASWLIFTCPSFTIFNNSLQQWLSNIFSCLPQVAFSDTLTKSPMTF